MEKEGDKRRTDLFGKDGFIVIHNELDDTLNLSGYFLKHVPFKKEKVAISILPNEVDTIICNYNFREFLVLESSSDNKLFRLFNGPRDQEHYEFVKMRD